MHAGVQRGHFKSTLITGTVMMMLMLAPFIAATADLTGVKQSPWAAAASFPVISWLSDIHHFGRARTEAEFNCVCCWTTATLLDLVTGFRLAIIPGSKLSTCCGADCAFIHW